MERKRVCFIVNPFAGLGGPLGLKGTDMELIRRAIKTEMKLIALERAHRFLEALSLRGILGNLYFLTASGRMGAELLRTVNASFDIVYTATSWPTTPHDTILAARKCLEKSVSLIVFVGGDGTSRDILEAIGGNRVPVIGVPAGVKMFSSVFAINPEAAANVIEEWINKGTSICEAEIVDYDEAAYRKGELRLLFHGVVKTLCSSYLVGSSKQIIRGDDVEENRKAVARYVVELMEQCTLYILGPGSTIRYIADELGVEKTVLGVDVVHNARLVAKDVNEELLYRIVSSHLARGGRVKIIVTPIGGQGFILGRGNQPISPRVIKLVGRNNIIVVADRLKMQGLRKLRVDTGDREIDEMLRGYIRVIIDYGEEVVVRIE